MSTVPTGGKEQLSVERLIQTSVEVFEKSLDGWKLFWLTVHSQPDPLDFAKKIARDRGRQLFDNRRKLGARDQDKRDYLETMAEDSQAYLQWSRENSHQPLAKDTVVSQCVGFENLLKTLAVASCLCMRHANGLDRLIFVPNDEFRTMHKEVNKKWDSLHKPPNQNPLADFLAEYLLGNQTMTSKYSRLRKIDLEATPVQWREIFKLRNALAHSRGRPVEQISVGRNTFSPFEEAAVAEEALREIDTSFRKLSGVFGISLDDV